ncbi:MAG: protocatechuate 3,4-dioxygenase subunit alpha [Ramlibacter sp.]|nr:protocatechuate 3,4-dioxygenase subunit alpha [Ramlibacter sp.]
MKTPLMTGQQADFGPTPSQTVGPFFAYGLTARQYGYNFGQPFDDVVALPQAQGQHIVLEGCVFDGDGQAIGDAMVEISQADAQGQYPADIEAVQTGGFRGFGRMGTGTDARKHFRFRTVKPGAEGPGQAPHINVVVLMRGLLLHAFTRIYFSDEAAANAADPLLNRVPADRRETLIAQRSDEGGLPAYRIDIHMQGPRETVFFDV